MKRKYRSGLSMAMMMLAAGITSEAATLHVDLTSPGPTPPYSTWATAATNIQDAVAAAADGDTVLVTNGLYTATSEIMVTNDVIIKSVNGPASTLVDGGGSNRCFTLDSTINRLEGFTIQNGYAGGDEDQGGGVYCINEASIITNCTLRGNYANHGGGIARGIAENCRFINNSAVYGGGMYVGTADHCLFEGNEAMYSGGAIQGSLLYYNYRKIGSANHCIFIKNKAFGERNGGGPFSGGGGGVAYGTATHSLFAENSANYGIGGGALSSDVRQCVFTGNSGAYGGGLGAYYSELGYGDSSAVHCTFTGNDAILWGGGLYCSAAINCISWFNTAGRGGSNIAPEDNEPRDSHAFYWPPAPTFTCSPDIIHDERYGNYTNAPLLVSSSHIAPDSPCVGAGTNLGFQADIDGEPWNVPPAIGCDQPEDTAGGPIEMHIVGFPARVLINFEIDVIPVILGACSEFRIELGDGQIHTNYFVSNNTILTHHWEHPGLYGIVLTAFNADYPTGLSITQQVEVVTEESAAIYVAPTGSKSSSGATWATAKATIQEGIDAQLVPGGTVWITNGTYHLTKEVSITRPITVQSFHGATETLVDGGGSTRCFNLVGTACVLRGLTIAHGSAEQYGDGGGIYCHNQTPVVEHCIIQSNSAYFGGGMSGGTANQCLFESNTAHDWGGGMYRGLAHQCRFDGNASTSAYGRGGGIAYGTASHCTLISNTAVDEGGGAYQSTVVNSLFTQNSAEYGGGMATYQSNSGYDDEGPSHAINSTFVENHADAEGGGLYNTPATNCIVWHNTASITGQNLNPLGGTATTCSPNVLHGENGNITNAPLFVDIVTEDYHLQSNSPCINWGSDEYVSGTTDLDGNPRIVGAHVDMGAYEFQTDLGPDSDGNGLSDEWELNYFGYRVLPTENHDGDAANNGSEFIAGTDPTDPTSLFAVTNATLTAEGFIVQWEPLEGRSYSVWWSDALTNDFQHLATDLPYPVNSYTDTIHNTEGASFYHLEVELAE